MMEGMAAMMLVWILLVVALATLAIAATVRLLRRRRAPLEELDRRYARGKLTTEQYQRRRHELTGERWPSPDWPA